MKKFAFLATILVASAANAGEIKSTITDSVQLNVQGAAVQSQRVGSSYSTSGTNIDVVTLGTLTGGTASAPATLGTTDYKINATGQAFSFGESLTIGDTAVTSQSVASGQIASPTLFGNNTTQLGGNAGTLAGTLSTTGVSTVTAGGPGTTGTAQRSVELSVFK
jgi:hypothetical protein